MYQTEANIIHPAQVLISGKSGSGKTYLAVQMVKKIFADQIRRLIIVCPTFYTQDTFRGLDDLITDKERDVFTTLRKETFDLIFHQLKNQLKIASQKGVPPIPNLILIDDCGGDNAIHGGRISGFGNLSIQLRHLNASSIVIVQNPKLVSPNFRENASHFIFFPAQRRDEAIWLNNEFNPNNVSKDTFSYLISYAWNGAKKEDTEYGKHFLYIWRPPREKTRFFSDFGKELVPDELV